MKKYELIFQDLENKILKKIYDEGEFLPSEMELSDYYEASRATIRQALNILESRGFIQKQKGKGSLVISSEKLNFPISGLTSYKELQESLDFKSSTKVLRFEKIQIDDGLHLLTLLPKDAYAWHILRARKIEGKYSVLDRDYLLYNLAPDLTEDIVKNSLYEYLEDELGLLISYANKEITIDFLDEDDRKYIDLAKIDHHVVSVKSHVYLADTTPLQYTESRHQVDKFRFTEFARRQKI